MDDEDRDVDVGVEGTGGFAAVEGSIVLVFCFVFSWGKKGGEWDVRVE